MRIGLVDIDGHNFPNLALMKLSAYHKNECDSVEFALPLMKYDRIYMSQVFTWSKREDIEYCCDDIRTGGSGIDMGKELPPYIEHMTPDYSLYGIKDMAYGFFTRGCPRKCDHCLVPQKEGMIRPASELSEFIDGNKQATLLDNNVLASPFGLSQIEETIKNGIRVDFNQGLDARLVAANMDLVKLLSKVKWIRMIRFACDSDDMMEPVEKAVTMLRDAGVKKEFFAYVLGIDFESAKRRVDFLKSIDVLPFVQPYMDFSGKKVEHDIMMKRLARWSNRYWMRNVSFEDFLKKEYYDSEEKDEENFFYV